MRSMGFTALALKRVAVASTAVFLSFTAGSLAAHAAPLAVTFAPSVVVAGASNFTADKLNLLDYSRVDLGTTTGGMTAFTESGYLQVNNASLANNTFNPAGNRSTYSLYFDFSGNGTQSAPNFNGSSTGQFDALTYTLYEAPGASTFGINGSNQPFVNNAGGAPTALATGSLIAGTTSFSTTPLGAAANIDATFIEQVLGFIVSPANSTLTLHGAFNNNSQIITVLNGGRSFTLNGGGGDMSFSAVATPEPASMALLGAGLIGIAAIRRRRKEG